MKKCKNITFCHFFAFGGPCDVQKWVKVYKVYVSWKPCLYSLRRHQKKWFLSNWGRTRCNRSAQGLKMANCTSFKILTHIHVLNKDNYIANLCPNVIHVDALDFSECRSEEVIRLFWRSVYFIRVPPCHHWRIRKANS